MHSSSVTTKGQVTIPAELREKLGFKPGDRVSFVDKNGKLEMQRQENRIGAAFGIVKARRGVSLKQMENVIVRGALRHK